MHCVKTPKQGRHLLLLARLRVDDLGNDGGALALLHRAVDVQHALVARREDGVVLQQLQDLRQLGNSSISLFTL